MVCGLVGKSSWLVGNSFRLHFIFGFRRLGGGLFHFRFIEYFVFFWGNIRCKQYVTLFGFYPILMELKFPLFWANFFFGFVLTIYWRIVCFVSIRLYLPILFVLFLFVVVVVVFKEIS